MGWEGHVSPPPQSHHVSPQQVNSMALLRAFFGGRAISFLEKKRGIEGSWRALKIPMMWTKPNPEATTGLVNYVRVMNFCQTSCFVDGLPKSDTFASWFEVRSVSSLESFEAVLLLEDVLSHGNSSMVMCKETTKWSCSKTNFTPNSMEIP